MSIVFRILKKREFWENEEAKIMKFGTFAYGKSKVHAIWNVNVISKSE